MAIDRFSPAALKVRFPDLDSLRRQVSAYLENVESRTEDRPVAGARADREGNVPTEKVRYPYTHAGLAAWLGIGMKDLTTLRYDEEFKELHGYLSWVEAKIEERMIDLGYSQRGSDKVFDLVAKNRLDYSDKLQTKNQNMMVSLTFISAPKDRDEAAKLLKDAAKGTIAESKKTVVKIAEAAPRPVELVPEEIPLAEIVEDPAKPEISGDPTKPKRGRPRKVPIDA